VCVNVYESASGSRCVCVFCFIFNVVHLYEYCAYICAYVCMYVVCMHACLLTVVFILLQTTEHIQPEISSSE